MCSPMNDQKQFKGEQQKTASFNKSGVFLSYARADAERVKPIYQRLSGFGFKPWMDSEDILPGEDWKATLLKAIREAPFFVACLSKNSVNRRGAIQEEIREALDVWRQKLDSDIYLIPLRLEECEVPQALRKFQWLDLFEENGFDRLKKAIKAGMERLGIIQPIRLRSRPHEGLSGKAVVEMLRERDFFDKQQHWMGRGIQHDYQQVEINAERLVVDRATDLMWQESGSEDAMDYQSALAYVAKLNANKYAGFADWRLPTLEEAMSLMEPRKWRSREAASKPEPSDWEFLFIHPVFASGQDWLWTADRWKSSGRWTAHFGSTVGNCEPRRTTDLSYVRSVRTNS
jgi:hypothetical protein